MPDNHQKFKNIKAFEESHKSFHFLNPEIMGCDLDYCYEKNGKILILEGKEMYKYIFYLKYAQWKLLKEFNKNDNCFVYFLIKVKDKDEYFLENISSDNLKGKDKYLGQSFFRHVGHGYSKKIDFSNIKPITRDEVKNKILNITNTFRKI